MWNPAFFETPHSFWIIRIGRPRLVNLVSPVADLTCDIKKEAPSPMMGTWIMGWDGGDLVGNPRKPKNIAFTIWDNININGSLMGYNDYNGTLQWDSWDDSLLVGALEHFCWYFSHHIGKMSSSQVTKLYIFQRGSKHQPVTYIVRILERYYPGYDTQEKRRGLLKTTLG